MSLQTLVLGFSLAGAPTAIVDSVTGVPGLHPFELLDAGTEIAVSADGRVRLAYFASCIHETVSGGNLRVGVTASLVEDAEVERVTGSCLAPGENVRFGGAPAALLLRDSTAPARPPVVKRVRTRYPVLVASPGAVLELTRVDPPGGGACLSMANADSDVARSWGPLDAGSTYRACLGGTCTEFWVDPHADGPAGLILERIIRVGR